MAIIKWHDPFNMLHRWPLMSEEDLWPEDREGLSVFETDNEVVVKASVAGVPADKVDVSVEGGVLTIKAEHRETEEEKKKKKVVYREAKEAKYYYTTSIPTAVKADAAKAEVKDGIVTISLPKSEEAKPKKITVKAQVK
jgi:HSP20 family protein